MDSLDDVLRYVLTTTGRTVDRLTNLQRATIALSVAYIGSRGSPSLIERAAFNRFSVRGLNYLRSHPFAFGAGYIVGAWWDESTRTQWAGSLTREATTAVSTAVFATGGHGIRAIGRGAAFLLRPEINEGAAVVGQFSSRFRLPRIIQWAFFHRYRIAVTRFLGTQIDRGLFGLARYLARHPVGFLSAYLTSQYINDTYRPQWFGIFSQDIITLGLTPLYSHGSRALPTFVRGLGTGAYYGSRGLATSIEYFTGRYGSPAPRARQGRISTQVNRPLAGLSFGLLAEFFQHRERINAANENRAPALWARFPGTGAAAAALLTGTSYFPPRKITAAVATLARARTSISRSPFVQARWQFIRSHWTTTRGRWALGVLLFDEIVGYANWSFIGYMRGNLPWWYYGLTAPVTIPGIGWFSYGVIMSGSPRQAWRGVAHHVGPTLERAAWLSRVSGLSSSLSRAGNALRSTSAAVAASPSAILAGGLLTASARGLSAVSRATGLVLFSRTLANASLWAGAGLDLADTAQQFFQTLDRRQADAEVLAQTPPELLSLVRNAMRERDQEEFATQTAGWTMAPSRWMGGFFGVNYQAPGTTARQILTANIVRLQNDEEARRELVNAGQQLALVAAGAADLLARAAQSIGTRSDVRPPWRQLPPFVEPEDYHYTWRTRPLSGNWPPPFGPPRLLPDITFRAALDRINELAREAAFVQIQSGGIGAVFQHSGGGASAPLGHKGRQFWLYRGRDRNLMEQLLRDLEAIEERDALEESGKKTRKISVRKQIFPNNVAGLQGAVIQLIRALKYDLSLVRSRGPLGGFYQVQIGE